MGLDTKSALQCPFRVAWAVLAWALKGALGFLAALAVLTGYALVLSLLLVSVLKVLHPTQTGLWIGPAFGFGFEPFPHPGSREVLGWTCIPLAIALGAGTFLGTTRLARTCLRFQLRRLRRD